MQLSLSFVRSYEKFESYPRNLIQKSSYPAALEAYANRLTNASATLFTDQDINIHVPVREFVGQSMSQSSQLLAIIAKHYSMDEAEHP